MSLKTDPNLSFSSTQSNHPYCTRIHGLLPQDEAQTLAHLQQSVNDAKREAEYDPGSYPKWNAYTSSVAVLSTAQTMSNAAIGSCHAHVRRHTSQRPDGSRVWNQGGPCGWDYSHVPPSLCAEYGVPVITRSNFKSEDGNDHGTVKREAETEEKPVFVKLEEEDD